MRLQTRLVVTIALGALASWPAGAQPHSPPATPLEAACPAPPPLPPPFLPHTRAALATNRPLLVVALGSSSTRGWMATGIGYSYPAMLQRRLGEALPKSSFAVINRGIGGQDAPEELARLDADVLAIRPQLVIWQAGANGAIHDASPAAFRRLMQEGIDKLKAAGADVILMDNQRSPRILAAPEHARMDDALHAVAAETSVNMFSRAALMDHWAGEGTPNEDFVAPDGLHMNDRGYRCLAEALAGTIVAALQQPIAQQTETGRKPKPMAPPAALDRAVPQSRTD